jgi:hypothetical protein
MLLAKNLHHLRKSGPYYYYSLVGSLTSLAPARIGSSSVQKDNTTTTDASSRNSLVCQPTKRTWRKVQ